MKHNPFSCNGKTRWCANAAEAPMDQSHYWTEPSLSLSDTVQGKTTRTHHEIEQIKAQRGISNSAEAKKKKNIEGIVPTIAHKQGWNLEDKNNSDIREEVCDAIRQQSNWHDLYIFRSMQFLNMLTRYFYLSLRIHPNYHISPSK